MCSNDRPELGRGQASPSRTRTGKTRQGRRRVLEPFKDPTEALEEDYIAQSFVPCIMSVLDSHIEAEIAAFVSGSSSANATEVMLLDHSDRWDELPKLRCCQDRRCPQRTHHGLEWLDATKRTLWRRIELVECKRPCQADIAEKVQAGSASNGIGRPEERGVDGGETPGKKQKKKGFLKRCVATAKAVGAGDDEEDGGLDGAVRDAGASSSSTAPPLSWTAMMQTIDHELQRFMLEKGLDDDNDNDDKSNGEDISWWCRHQFANPTQARLAKTYLAIPASSAAPERGFLAAGSVVTKKRDKLGDDTAVDALVFCDGSHGLERSSGISQEALAGRTRFFFFVWRRRLGS